MKECSEMLLHVCKLETFENNFYSGISKPFLKSDIQF